MDNLYFLRYILETGGKSYVKGGEQVHLDQSTLFDSVDQKYLAAALVQNSEVALLLFTAR